MHSTKASVPREAAAYKEYLTTQRQELLSYFHYDDGIDHCVGSVETTTPLQKYLDEETLFEFKQMKFNLLKTVVNDPLRWMVSLPPRTATTVVGSSTIPTFSMDVIGTLDQDIGLMNIISTCRLLGLAKEDYNGRAKEVLEGLLKKYGNVPDAKFRMIPGSPELEYRARVWLKRLVLATLQKFKDIPTTSSSSAEEAERLVALQRNNASIHEIMESHVRLEELQALELVLEYTNQYLEREKMAAKHIHEKPCPAALSADL